MEIIRIKKNIKNNYLSNGSYHLNSRNVFLSVQTEQLSQAFEDI